MTSRLLAIATQLMVMAIILSVVLLFVGVGFLVLLHICIVGRAFRRGLSTIGRGEMRMDGDRGLSPQDLEQLPCYDFKVSEKGFGAIDCAVCLENFQVGDKCRLLPICRHSFHAQCVDSWLRKSPICPICRSNVVSIKKEMISEIEMGDSFGRVEFEFHESQSVVVGFTDATDPSHLHPPTLQ